MTGANPGTSGSELLAAATGSWALDPGATSVEFRSKSLWGLANVVGRMSALEGNAAVDGEGHVSGTLIIDATSVDTKNKRRDKHLKSADFFEVIKYPTLTYTMTGATPTADGRFAVTGTLSVHGQSRPVDLLATFESSADRATITAETDIDRSEWGLTWAKLGAQLLNHVVVVAQFTRA